MRSSGSHYRWIEKGRRIIWNIVVVYKFNAGFQLLVQIFDNLQYFVLTLYRSKFK